MVTRVYQGYKRNKVDASPNKPISNKKYGWPVTGWRHREILEIGRMRQNLFL